MKNALGFTLMMLICIVAVIVILVVLGVVDCYRVNYAGAYGQYALIFGVGYYVPLYSLPASILFLGVMLFLVFLKIEKRERAYDIVEFFGAYSLFTLCGAVFLALPVAVTIRESAWGTIILTNALGIILITMPCLLFCIMYVVIDEAKSRRKRI